MRVCILQVRYTTVMNIHFIGRRICSPGQSEEFALTELNARNQWRSSRVNANYYLMGTLKPFDNLFNLFAI